MLVKYIMWYLPHSKIFIILLLILLLMITSMWLTSPIRSIFFFNISCPPFSFPFLSYYRPGLSITWSTLIASSLVFSLCFILLTNAKLISLKHTLFKTFIRTIVSTEKTLNSLLWHSRPP